MGLTRNGTVDADTGKSRVYGGDLELVHIQDGKRRDVGAMLARFYDVQVRGFALARGANYRGALCPGCYMVAIYNLAVTLAQTNAQPLSELGATLANQFALLASHPEIGTIEEIEVLGGRGAE